MFGSVQATHWEYMTWCRAALLELGYYARKFINDYTAGEELKTTVWLRFIFHKRILKKFTKRNDEHPTSKTLRHRYSRAATPRTMVTYLRVMVNFCSGACTVLLQLNRFSTFASPGGWNFES